MGGIPCKVIVDYGNWMAESAGLMTLAAKSTNRDVASELVAEAAACKEAALAGWTAGLEAIEYDSANEQAVLEQSKKVCDWAKDMRMWRDALTQRHSAALYDDWITTMREWRDADAAFYQAFAESGG